MIDHLLFKFETLKRDFNTALDNNDFASAMNFYTQEIILLKQICDIQQEIADKRAKKITTGLIIWACALLVIVVCIIKGA